MRTKNYYQIEHQEKSAAAAAEIGGRHRFLIFLAAAILSGVALVGLIIIIIFALLGMPPAVVRHRCQETVGCSENCTFWRVHNMTFLCTTGNLSQMGEDYGWVLQEQLLQTRAILEDYMTSEGFDPAQIAANSDLFHSRYSRPFESFLIGASNGSGLSFEDMKLLNGMETVFSRSNASLGTGCAFLAAPQPSGDLLVGRNYDYPHPFDRVAGNLVVAVLRAPDRLPVVVVSLPGQAYCPTCFNSRGLFTSLNNGGWSGGFEVNQDRRSLLIGLLEFLQAAEGMDDMKKLLHATQSDYSLIINSVLGAEVSSFEFSSTKGYKEFLPPSGPFASTNSFQHPSWPSPPSDPSWGWYSELRRKNLLNLTEHVGEMNLAAMKQILDVPFIPGTPGMDKGAKRDRTIYQIVFDSSSLHLSLRSLLQNVWVDVDMKKVWLKED